MLDKENTDSNENNDSKYISKNNVIYISKNSNNENKVNSFNNTTLNSTLGYLVVSLLSVLIYVIVAWIAQIQLVEIIDLELPLVVFLALPITYFGSEKHQSITYFIYLIIAVLCYVLGTQYSFMFIITLLAHLFTYTIYKIQNNDNDYKIDKIILN